MKDKFPVKKQKIKYLIYSVLLAIFLAFLTATVMFPLYFVLATSLKSYTAFVQNPIGINLANLEFSNYSKVLENNNILGSFINSVIVTGISVACTVIFSALASFAVGVIKFRGCAIIYFIAVSTMFFTGEVTYIPLYIMYYKMQMLNKIWALILPSFLGLPGLGIILGSTFIKKIPKEIHEAALLDGAPLSKLFLKIDLRLLAPVLSMVAIMQFQSSWSDFFWPLITVSGNPDIYTMPLLLINFKAADATMYGQYCAGLTLMALPIVVFYCFFSKYFIEGVAAGSIKG